MAILPIVKYPNEILEEKCKTVKVFNKTIQKQLDDMYETMLEADGVGLAAPQIGSNKRMAVIEVDEEIGRIDLVNPLILKRKGQQTDVEGCLSFPSVYGTVTRADYVKVQAQDGNGEAYIIEAEGFLARAIQHEMDHLDGILFTSKIEEYIDEADLEMEEQE